MAEQTEVAARKAAMPVPCRANSSRMNVRGKRMREYRKQRCQKRVLIASLSKNAMQPVYALPMRVVQQEQRRKNHVVFPISLYETTYFINAISIIRACWIFVYDIKEYAFIQNIYCNL
jgi:hypothetical protein